jgi:hypothetical protein
MNLAQLIEYMIYALGNSVTFAQLESELQAVGVDAAGEHEIAIDSHDIVLWCCLSAAVSDAIRQLQHQGRIAVEPCDVLAYAIDGKTLNYPLVERLEIYDSPHWCPVTLSVEPMYKRVASRMLVELKR